MKKNAVVNVWCALAFAFGLARAVSGGESAAPDLATLPKRQSGAPAYPPPFLAVARTPAVFPREQASFVIPEPNHRPTYGGPPAAFSGLCDDATGQFGFPGMIGDEPLQIAYDDDKLVFFMTIGPPYRRTFRANVTDRDGDFSGDDTFELLIAPLVSNNALRDRVYRIAGNPAGARRFRVDDPAIGQYDLPWTTNIGYGVGIWKDGRWVIAAQVPFAELGGAPRDGETWGVQMVLHYTDPPITARLAPTDPVERPSLAWGHFARVRFDQHGAANFRAHHFSAAQSSDRFQIARLFSNTGTESASVETSLRVYRAGEAVTQVVERVEVPAQTRRHTLSGRLVVAAPLADDTQRDTAVRITAVDARNGATIYDQFLPYWRPPAGQRKWLDDYFGKEFTFLTGPYPSAGAFDYRVDCKTLMGANTNAATVRVTARLDGRELDGRTVALTPAGVLEGILRVGKMPDGAVYKLVAAILDRNGREISAKTDTFTRHVMPFETALKPGLSDIVAPPFTPPVIDGAAVSCWNRTYRHGAPGLLTSLTAAGAELLARPVSFLATVGDGAPVFLTGAAPELKPRGKGRVDYRQEFSGGAIRLRVEGDFDYDGFYRFRARLAPENAPVDLRALKLEIPLRAAVAQLLEAPADWDLRDRAAEVTGLLGDRRGRLWDSKSLPYDRGTSQRRGNMPPFVWLGDDERGLVFSCVSEQGMHNDDALPAAALDRDATEALLTVWAVNKPLRLETERVFEFALQASPYKPLPDHFRLWRTAGATRGHELFGAYERNGTFFHTGWGAREGAYPCYSRFASLEVLKQTVARFKEKGHDIISANASGISEGAGTPEYLQFWREWGSPLGFDRQPRSPLAKAVREELVRLGVKDPSPLVMVEAKSNNYRSNVDYRTWWLDQEVRHAGVGAIYQDNGTFQYVGQPLADYGYVRDDGGYEPGNTAWNARDFMKRVRVLMNENGVTNSPGVFANLISPAAPGRSFCGIFLTGENPESDRIPLGKMRIWFSKQWGIIPSWFWSPKDQRRPVSYWRTVAGRLFLLDVANATGHDPVDCIRRWWLTLDAFWLDDPSVVWHPYYRTELVESTAHPQTLVSAYTADGRALFVVSNQDDKDGIAGVTLRPLAPHTQVPLSHFYDAESGEEIETNGATLKMFIPALDYRLVLGFAKPWAFAAKQTLGQPDLPAGSTRDRRCTVTERVRQLQAGPDLALPPLADAHPVADAWIQAIVAEIKADREADPASVICHGVEALKGLDGNDPAVSVAVIEHRRKKYRLMLYVNDSDRDLLLDRGVREAIDKRIGAPARGYTLDAIEGYSFWTHIALPSRSGRIELRYWDPKDYQSVREGVFKAGTFISHLARAARARAEERNPNASR